MYELYLVSNIERNLAQLLTMELIKPQQVRYIYLTISEEYSNFYFEAKCVRRSQFLPHWFYLQYKHYMNLYPQYFQATAVRARAASLCAEIGPHSLAICEAFAITDSMLSAPIARDWVDYNEYDNQGEVKE